MTITTKAIKSSDENICGAEFSVAGSGSGVGVGYQGLTFNAFNSEEYPSTVAGVLGLVKNSASATVQVDSKISVSFNLIEVEDSAPVIQDPNSQEPAVPHKNAQVAVVVLYGGEVMFTKSYLLQEQDESGNWVNTSESGVYVGGGFSISMPTQMGAPYKATFQRTDLHAVQIRINASTSAITATAKVAFPLEDKARGFTTRELKEIDKSIRQFEGETDFMYKDDKGNVTVGVGFMMPDESAAVSLPFVYEDGPASEEQKRAEWRTINALASGYVASWYEDSTELYLEDEFITSHLQSLVAVNFTELTRIFPDYGEYPSAARLALQDMIYNLGMTNFNKFTKLKAAVVSRDWETAAAESHRTIRDESRNDAVRDLFLKAAE